MASGLLGLLLNLTYFKRPFPPPTHPFEHLRSSADYHAVSGESSVFADYFDVGVFLGDERSSIGWLVSELEWLAEDEGNCRDGERATS